SADTNFDYVDGPPTILGISPDTGASTNDGVTSAPRISLHGIATANLTVNLYRNGAFIGSTTADGQGNWTFDSTGTSLADGTYNFTATATDPKGFVSDPSFPFRATIDTQAPTAPAI